MNEEVEEQAMISLRDMMGQGKSPNKHENLFESKGVFYIVPPIPKWADYLFTHGIIVKYGAWGYSASMVL